MGKRKTRIAETRAAIKLLGFERVEASMSDWTGRPSAGPVRRRVVQDWIAGVSTTDQRRRTHQRPREGRREIF